MAHKKGGGSSRNGRDSNPQNLGVKVFGGQVVTAGSILVRQRGSHISAGPGAAEGRDHTIFAMISGEVGYQRDGKTGRRAVVTPRGEVPPVGRARLGLPAAYPPATDAEAAS